MMRKYQKQKFQLLPNALGAKTISNMNGITTACIGQINLTRSAHNDGEEVFVWFERHSRYVLPPRGNGIVAYRLQAGDIFIATLAPKPLWHTPKAKQARIGG